MTTKTAALSRKVIETARTYDPSSLPSTGYDLTLYADGRVAAEGHSCQQGDRNGDRYTTSAGYLPAEPGTLDRVLARDKAGDRFEDAKLDPRGAFGDLAPAWRQTRSGWVVA